ncbi:MAG: 23S rRNA (uracil(1939)-C(5))-methyltransferase RlmD [Patescibacteria group bacterium]|jgi:23S rRNA (uracil1939-C5)-methyltransferase
MILKIEKLIYEGFGLGHDENGRAIFVKKSVPGDTLEVEVIKDKKKYAEARIVKVIEPSKLRIEPKCPHFAECGGCDFQNIGYADQLKFKEAYFKETLERQKVETEILPIISSRSDFYYRNTISFQFMEVDGQISLAMYDYLDYKKLIPIKTCLLQSETAILIMNAVVDWANENEIKNLRSLRLREGKRTDDYMVEIFTSSSQLANTVELREKLSQIPNIKSIYHCYEVDRRVRRNLLSGATAISEKIGKYTFTISPESSFQTNGANVEILYDLIKKFADVKIGESVLDLFCGTGTIGIYLSTFAKKVVGIELNQQAVNDAKANAKINKVPNIEFKLADLGRGDQSELFNEKFDVVVIDPPRAGLTVELIESLSKLSAPNSRLVYVSCDPATFARDIIEFQKYGRELKKVQSLDMFPQTYHLECVGLIS